MLGNIITKEYYDLLDIFSNKDSDIFLLYQKYDHKIISEKQPKYDRTQLHKMSPQKLDVIQRYLDTYLNNLLIQTNLVIYLSLVLFVKKLGRRIWFCVDY